MGIRVNKFLGYGLTDLTPGYRSDPRINWDSPLLLCSDEKMPTAGDYFTWLEARREAAGDKFSFSLDWALLRHDEERRGPDLYDCAAYEHEYGLKEVLALRPVTKDDWARSDDDLDYMEETYPWSERSQQNRVQVYEHGPFPFNGSYMDKRDGRRLSDVVFPWWQMQNGTRDREFREQAADLFAVQMGFTGHAEAAENVVPEVPEEIRDLAEFGRLFTHAGVWRQLRPLIYVYWS
jgi:hypothetical protein